ncbi:MAG: phosphatidylglycerophosphatase A [Deltaproteobacteria bacterium]|nr:phosphatidylglycerophosphatase A [Deltaproteobacteria bacterium]
MIDKNTAVMYLATGCKSGYSPVVPGTAGSLVALVPCGLLSLLPLPVSAVFLIAFIVLSIWAAELAEGIVGQKDPGCIVIDEIAGMMVTLLGIHFTWQSALAGFFIFRIMDIFKPFPIRYLERTIPGGAGIVVDDVAAGVAAHLVLRLLLMTPWMTSL